MKKIFQILDFIWRWTYFFIVVVLRLFRLISEKQFIELLLGEPKRYQDKDALQKRFSSKS